MRKWRIGLAVLLLAVLLVAVARRLLEDPEQRTAVLREESSGTAPATRERVVTDGVRPDGVRPDGERSRTASLTVHVVVEPPGGELEWTADIYLRPTPSRDRERIGGATRQGTATLTWDVPSDALAVHVRCRDGFGEEWAEIDAAPGDEPLVEARLHAAGRFRGRVTDETGRPLTEARVVFVPTATAPGPRGLPPALSGRDPLARHERSVETDPEGAYVLDGIDPRVPYHAAAAAPGHAVRRAYGLTVEAGGTTGHDFALELGCRVVGRLLDAEARPVEGARLDASTPSREVAGSVTWDREGESVTDADGRFAFDCLAPGWKKVQTVLEALPGETTVGHWECRVERGEVADLGDLVVPSSSFEARIEAPEGPVGAVLVRFGFLPDPREGVSEVGALLSVPVAADSDGVFRVRGLPPGDVVATVREDGTRDDGLVRPRTDFRERFDGTTRQVRWVLAPLRPAEVEERDARGLEIVPIDVALPDAQSEAVALLFVNGRLETIRPASGAHVQWGAGVGDHLRLVLTDGERWGESEIRVAGEETTLGAPAALDRTGNVLTVSVVDEGRAVAGAMVLVGPADADPDALVPYGKTDRDGRVVLGGLPADVVLRVSARVFRDEAESVVAEWVAGRAAVVLDVHGE